MDKLSTKEIVALRSQAQSLHAVVLVGRQGVTDAVKAEAECHLAAHGLIKVRVDEDERVLRVAAAQALCDATGAILVQHIGKNLVLYRQKKD